MDIDLLSAYLPLDRRHALATGQSLPDRTAGAALLADIAGFTSLADTLAAALGPRRGAEELTRLLNAVYDALVVQVHRYGGSVIVFVGDALVCWFDDDPGLRAVACGLAMQQAMVPFTVVETPGGTVSLSIKAGVSTGSARRFVVGDPQIQRLDVLAGATLDRMAWVEQAANRGEVVVGPAVVRQLGARLQVAERDEGMGVVSALAGEVSSIPRPGLSSAALTAEQVRPYLLPSVYERLITGQGEFLAELRPAVILFLRFGGLEYDHDDDAGPKLDAYVRWAQRTLGEYDGTLLQLTTGDKGSLFYAAFGALTAHEDDAGRALAAARDLQRIPADLSFITHIQIGVSQGRVWVGAYGSHVRRTYGTIGDEVNVACRLMEAAPAGEIRCSQRIHRAASQWDLEALPPIRIKGKPKPLLVYRPVRRRRARAARDQEALVGRRAEGATLARLLAEAQSGQRRVLLLEGEAGIGKSRLVDELRHLAQQQGAIWLEGAGQSIEQRTPYRAWRDLLAAFFDLDAQMTLNERQRRVRERVVEMDPALAERVPLLNDILRLDLPETNLTQSFDAKLRHESLTALVVDLMRAATADGSLVPRRALCVVLEDAHWLDSLSWELALAVARALAVAPSGGDRGEGLLLVLALRPLEEPLRAEYTALADLEGAETLRLEALLPEETVALAAARLGLAPTALPIAVADLMRERAEGNPFFAEELAHVLRDSGVLSFAENGCTVIGDLETLRQRVPDTVEGVVLSRIDRLSPAEQLTLKVAAVVGRSFLYRTLRDVHPRQVIEDLLRTHLDDLVQRDLTLLEALEPELTYLFKHIITQQVAYDTLLFAQRRDLHRAVADWYERVYADNLGPYYPLLVHHWNRADDMERERHYARLAGEQAAAQFANAEAIGYLSRALDLTPTADITERYALLLAREKVYDLQGARTAQMQDLADLMALAKALDDARRQAEVALRRAKCAEVTGDYAAAIAATRMAIDLAQEAQAVDLEAAGHLEWGVDLFRQGEYDASRHKLERCLALARSVKLRRVEADGLRNIGNTYFLQGDFARAQDYYGQALVICRDAERGDREGEGRTLNCLGAAAQNQGDSAGAVAYLEQALLICRQIGDLGTEGIVLGNLGNAVLYRGDYVRARILCEQSLRIRREVGDQEGEGIALDNLGVIWRQLGDYARAKSYVEQGLGVFRQVGERWGEGQSLAGLGLLSHLLGDDEASREHCRQARQIARELGIRHLEALASTFLGHALIDLGHLDEAADAYRQALSLRRESGELHLIMEPLAGLVRVSLVKGDVAQAQVEEILSHLETGSLDGAEEPFRIYLTCYRVLHVGRDPRAAEVLTTAYNRLQEQAARIDDEELRRSFLENVAAHREIVAAYQAMPAAECLTYNASPRV